MLRCTVPQQVFTTKTWKNDTICREQPSDLREDQSDKYDNLDVLMIQIQHANRNSTTSKPDSH